VEISQAGAAETRTRARARGRGHLRPGPEQREVDRCGLARGRVTARVLAGAQVEGTGVRGGSENLRTLREDGRHLPGGDKR
jgi:hypothetical protein